MKPTPEKAIACFNCVHFKASCSCEGCGSETSKSKCERHDFEFDIMFSPIFNKCHDFEAKK